MKVVTAEQCQRLTEQPEGDELFDDDVDEFLWYDDDFDDLAAVEMLGHFFIGLGKPANPGLHHATSHTDPLGIFKPAR